MAKQLQLSSINRENFIFRFLEIFPINETVYNGNIGEDNHFICPFQAIFPINGVPINGTQLYWCSQYTVLWTFVL